MLQHQAQDNASASDIALYHIECARPMMPRYARRDRTWDHRRWIHHIRLLRTAVREGATLIDSRRQGRLPCRPTPAQTAGNPIAADMKLCAWIQSGSADGLSVPRATLLRIAAVMLTCGGQELT